MKEYKDSEEIKRQLRIWVQECEDWLEHKEANCFRDCIDLIDQIPAADVVEVRHGRWEWYDLTISFRYINRGYRCSVCGHKEDDEPNYCPHCGAKMDKEE